jgi:hypothetical protein
VYWFGGLGPSGGQSEGFPNSSGCGPYSVELHYHACDIILLTGKPDAEYFCCSHLRYCFQLAHTITRLTFTFISASYNCYWPIIVTIRIVKRTHHFQDLMPDCAFSVAARRGCNCLCTELCLQTDTGVF